MQQHLTARMQAGTRPLHQGADGCYQSRLSSSTRPGAPHAQTATSLTFIPRILHKLSPSAQKCQTFLPFFLPSQSGWSCHSRRRGSGCENISKPLVIMQPQNPEMHLKMLKKETVGAKREERKPEAGAGKRDFCRYVEERTKNRPGFHPSTPRKNKKKSSREPEPSVNMETLPS